ncbi:hypothetical protein S83_010600 [Arachis hypogaea]
MKKEKSSVGLGYACHWTKIFTWLRIDLSEEKSVVLSNVAKIDDSTLRQMGRDPNAQEPQVQGQPQDPERQDRQTEAINRQGEVIDLLYTNLGITNSRGIIPRPGP